MQQYIPDRLVLFNSCLILIVGLFAMDLYTPSLPAIVQDLGTDQTLGKALSVAYLFGFGVSQLIYGTLSDYYGRRKIILFSVILAGIGNFLTYFITTSEQILVLRFITGLAAGGCPVISRAILSDTFNNKIKLTHAFAVFATASQVSPAFAPVIGGFIQEHFSWRPNFIVLFAICLFTALIIYLTLPETLKTPKKLPLKDMIRCYKSMLLNRFFVTNSLMSAIIFAYTIGYFTISPFVFQGEFMLSPSLNGIIYLVYSFGIIIGTRLIKPLMHKFPPEKIAINSIIALCATTIIMIICLSYTSNLPLFLFFTTSIAILCGLSAPIILSLSIFSFSHLGGSASAMQSTIKMLGGSLTLYVLLGIHVTNSFSMAIVFCAISVMLFSCMLFSLTATQPVPPDETIGG